MISGTFQLVFCINLSADNIQRQDFLVMKLLPFSGFEHPLVHQQCTMVIRDGFLFYPYWIRHVSRSLRECPVEYFPGNVSWHACKCLYLGHSFPYGRWMGGRILMSRDECLQIGRFISFLPSGGTSAADWDVPMVRFP